MSDRSGAASYDPGSDFWNGFVRRYWGRRPTVIRQPFAHAIASPSDVFAAMVAATHRVHTDDLDFGLTIDGVRVGADVERWLPTKKDRSLERLTHRIAGDLPGSSFAVFIRAFQLELGWEFWARLRHFLAGLYARVGVPAHRAEVDLFAGSYARTRRGIHLDSADVFCFVIEGRKRIRLWPGSTFPDDVGYWYGLKGERKHLSKSMCLDGEPGDILYWPASYWHVGESLGGTVSSLSLGLYPRDSLASTASRLIESDVARVLGADNYIEALPSSVRQLDALPARARRAFARASNNLALSLVRRRVEQVTGYAFDHIPPAPVRDPRRASVIVIADPAFPILCRSVGRTLIVAANGRSIGVPSSKAIREMIEGLNRGVAVPLSRRSSATHPQVRETIRFLLLSGAVEARRAGGSRETSRGR